MTLVPQSTIRLWAAGGVAYAGLDLAHHPSAAFGSAVVLGGGGVLTAVGRRRRQQRDTTVSRVTAAMDGVLGQRVHVERTRWTHGALAELVVSYPPAANDTDTAMRNHMAAAVTARIGHVVDLSWRPDRSMLRVRRREEVTTPTGDGHDGGGPGGGGSLVERVNVVVTLTMGHEARVEPLTWDEETLTGFRVRYPADARDALVDFRTRVDHVLREKTGAEWASWWEPEADTVTYARKVPLPVHVAHPASTDLGDDALPFGTIAGGKTMIWNLEAAHHLCVAGTTGGGKSVFLRGIAIEACRRGFRVVIVDPKRISLRGLRDWPGVTEVATTLDSMIRAVAAVHAEQEDRYARLEAGTVEPEDLAPLLLIVDETWEWMTRCRAAHKADGGKGEAPIVEALQSIVHLGREGRVHVLLGIQRPDAAVLGGDMREQLAGRIVLGDSPSARSMLNIDGRPSELVKGRAVANMGAGEQEVQVWWTPDPARKRLSDTDQIILDALRPRTWQAAADDYANRQTPPDPVSAEPPEPGTDDVSRPHLTLLHGAEPSPAPPPEPAIDESQPTTNTSPPAPSTEAPGSSSKRGAYACTVCGETGHNAARHRHDPPPAQHCRHCGQAGHNARSCPQKKSNV